MKSFTADRRPIEDPPVLESVNTNLMEQSNISLPSKHDDVTLTASYVWASVNTAAQSFLRGTMDAIQHQDSSEDLNTIGLEGEGMGVGEGEGVKEKKEKKEKDDITLLALLALEVHMDAEAQLHLNLFPFMYEIYYLHITSLSPLQFLIL